MQMRFRDICSLAGVVTTLLLLANTSLAQPPEAPAKRLKNPAVVRGFIGGESHDSYVIRATKGRLMTVQISWRREGDNHAGFTVSQMRGFFGAEAVSFGDTTHNEKRWTGKIPKTANYYIYVVAHPSAHYTLRVTIK